jgi:hypothetical protein
MPIIHRPNTRHTTTNTPKTIPTIIVFFSQAKLINDRSTNEVNERIAPKHDQKGMPPPQKVGNQSIAPQGASHFAPGSTFPDQRTSLAHGLCHPTSHTCFPDKDEDEIMPPPETDKPLTEEEIALFKRWIETNVSP